MHQLPTFATKRLILRAVTLEDEPAYTRHFVNYEVIRHLSDKVPWPYPDNGVSDYLRDTILPYQGKGKWVWGIFLKEVPLELVGAVALWGPGTPENRGFWLAEHLWGRGLMTEAVTPVMDHAFDELGFDELVFTNAAGNNRSRRVKEKTGATFVRREPAGFVDPKYKERELFKLTRPEWRAYRARPASS